MPEEQVLSIYPVGDGAYVAFSDFPSAGDDWVDVSEVTADDDTSYISLSSVNAPARSSVIFSASIIPTDATAISITCYLRVRETSSSTSNFKPFMRLGGTDLDGTDITDATTSYANNSQVMSRPGGGSWTAADVNAGLEAGIYCSALGALALRCTQIYLTVTYTAAIVRAINLWCDFKTSIVVPASGLQCFSAVYDGGSANSVVSGNVQVSTGVDFTSVFYDTGWVSVGTVASGSRSGNIIAGILIPNVPDNAYEANLWRVRFKNSAGSIGDWYPTYTGVYTKTITGNFTKQIVLYSATDTDTYVSVDGKHESLLPGINKVIVGVRAKRKSGQSSPIADTNYKVRVNSGSTWSATNVLMSGSSALYIDASDSVWAYSATTLSGFASTMGGTCVKIDWFAHDGANPENIDYLIDYVTYESTTFPAQFTVVSRPWWDQSYSVRNRLYFSGTHSALVSGNTMFMGLDAGASKIIATNCAFNEGIQGDAQTHVVYHGGKTHVVYLSQAVGNMGIYIVSKDHATNTWGSPYFISSALHSTDTHVAPKITNDLNGYLHIFYGGHSSYAGVEYVRYRRSVQPYKSGSGDDGTWTSEQDLIYYGTYPTPFVRSNGWLYVFYREGTTDYEVNLAYRYSTDGGSSWSASQYFAYNDTTLGGNSSSIRVYMMGFHYDPKLDRVHVGFSFTDTDNASLAASYAYSQGEAAGHFVTWKKADGTVCGTTNTSATHANLISYGDQEDVQTSVISGGRQFFSRNIVIDSQGRQHLFYTSDRVVDKFYNWNWSYNPGTQMDFGYTYGGINHAVYTGLWSIHDASSQTETYTWNARMGVKPIIDQDDVLRVYMVEKALRPITIRATITGTSMDFVRSAGTDVAYTYINYHNDDYDPTKWLQLSGSTGYLSFSGTSALTSGHLTDSIDLEFILCAMTGTMAAFQPYLRISGVNYFGPTVHMTTVVPTGYVYTWNRNPANNQLWGYSTETGMQMGIYKSIAAGGLKVYDMQLRAPAIVSSNRDYYSGEIVELVSRDLGATWTKQYITNFSAMGAPQLGIKDNFTNNQLELIWCAGRKLFFYNTDPLSYYNNDGSDVRVVWSGIEIDRDADYWNSDTTVVSFPLQESVSSSRAYSFYDYYLYGRNINAVSAKNGPTKVNRMFQGFEEAFPHWYAGYVTRTSGFLTKGSLVYSATNSDTYDASFDSKDETTLTGIDQVIVTIRGKETSAVTETNCTVRVRVCSGSTWSSSKVLASGSNNFSPANYPNNWSSMTVTVTGFSSTLQGTCVKADWYIASPSNEASIAMEMDTVEYRYKTSGVGDLIAVTGHFHVHASPPGHNNNVYGGTQSITAYDSNGNILNVMCPAGMTNVWVSCQLLPSPVAAGYSQTIEFVNGAGNSCGMGIYTFSISPAYYRTVFGSGVVWGYGNSLSPDWHNFLACVTSTGTSMWVDNVLLAGNSQAITSFDKIKLSALGRTNGPFVAYDQLMVWDYLNPDPTIGIEAMEHRGIHFLASIQGTNYANIKFNFILNQWFAALNASVRGSWGQVNKSDGKIVGENATVIKSDNKPEFDWSGYTTVDYKIVAEDISSVKFDDNVHPENVLDAKIDGKIIFEDLSSVNIDDKILSEIITNIKGDGSEKFNWSGYTTVDFKIVDDNTTILKSDSKLEFDWSGYTAVDYKIAIEDISRINIDGKPEFDWSGYTAVDYKIAIEDISRINIDGRPVFDWRGYTVADYKIVVEDISVVKFDDNVHPENVLDAKIDGKIIFEDLSSVNIDDKIISEVIANIKSDGSKKFDWSGYTTLTCGVPFSHGYNVYADSLVPINYLQNLTFDCLVSGDGMSSVAADYKFVYDHLKNITSDFKFVDEYLYLQYALCKLYIDSQYLINVSAMTYFSNVKNLEALAKITFGVLALIKSDEKNVFGVLAELKNDFKLMSDWVSLLKTDAKFAVGTSEILHIYTKILCMYDILVKSDIKPAPEWVKNIMADAKIDYEDLVSLIILNSKLPLDQSSIIGMSVLLPVGCDKLLKSDHLIPVEWAGIVETVSDAKINVDILGTVKCDHKIDDENILPLMSDASVGVEFLGTMYSDSKISLAGLKNIISDDKIVLDKCVSIISEAKICLDKLWSADINIGVPVDWGKLVFADNKFCFDNIGGVSLSFSGKIPIGLSSIINADGKCSLENLFINDIDCKIIWDSAATLDINSDAKIPAGHLLTIAGDGKLSYDIGGIVLVGASIKAWADVMGILFIDTKINDLYLTNLINDASIICDFSGTVIADGRLILDDSLMAGINFGLPKETLSIIHGAAKLVDEWIGTVMIEASAKMSLGYVGSVVSDVRLTVDFGHGVFGFSSVPIEHALRIFVNSRVPFAGYSEALRVLLLTNMTLLVPKMYGFTLSLGDVATMVLTTAGLSGELLTPSQIDELDLAFPGVKDAILKGQSSVNSGS